MASIVNRGKNQWFARVRRKGVYRVATFRSKAMAEAWAIQIEAEIDARRLYPGQSKADETSLHQALEDYLRLKVPLKSGVSQATGILRQWQAAPFAKRPMSEIRAAEIALYRDKLLTRLAPQTVVHHLNLFSNLFNVAAREWGMDSLVNPVSRISKPKLPPGRDRRVTPEEEVRLLNACGDSQSGWLRPMVVVALETAMRQGEIVGLNWEDVNFKANTIILRTTKNGTARTVPLSKRVQAIFKELNPSAKLKGRIFEIETGRGVSHAFAKVCTDCNFTNLRFHDLRHEAISRLFEKTDFRDLEIASITGHRTMTMLMRYAHLRAKDFVARLP